MMESIVEERLVSFKELEQKIFAYVCIGPGDHTDHSGGLR